MQENNHGKISPTAKIAAYWRSFSDIPFAKEMAAALHAEQTARQMLGNSMATTAAFSPLILETRYKAIDLGLQHCGVNNVLELACGLSARGLAMAPGKGIYMGTDLPEILAETYPVIQSLAGKRELPVQHLHFQAVNVLNKQQLQAAAAVFRGEKFGICNEGLLMYLNREEKATMAINLRELLAGTGGCWVTTDVVFSDTRKKIFESLQSSFKTTVESLLGNVSGQVGRDIAANDFTNEDEAEQFYAGLGFTVEKYPWYDGSYQPSTLHLVPREMQDRVLQVLSNAMVWVLSV